MTHLAPASLHVHDLAWPDALHLFISALSCRDIIRKFLGLSLDFI